jgi:ATP-dependent DNA ligase
MILLQKLTLVTRNARDKVQVIHMHLSQQGNSFFINRITGQYGGKMTEQPTISIEKGKAKRSILQQADLEFTSTLNKYLDKGYKRLDSLTKKDFNSLTASEIDELVPTLKTDQSGNLKPMLCKAHDKVQNSVLQKPMYCSTKLNGVRMLAKYDESLDKVITISRGGKNYNAASKLITDELYDFLSKHPEYTLDGELYVHGRYLQEISGIARLETFEDRCKILEYWIYDLAIPDMKFEDRNVILKSIQKLFSDSSKIKVLSHVKTKSWGEIETLHNNWVEQGFEGLVARKPDKMYEFGKRGSTMIKVKSFIEETFEIIDYSEKLRDEDFCFILQTDKGVVFEAKPIGSREIKDDYLKNMDSIIGRKGDVRFFEWSRDGSPLQARFQAVRYDL